MSKDQTDAPPAEGLAFMRGASGWKAQYDVIPRIKARVVAGVTIKRFDLRNDRVKETGIWWGECGDATQVSFFCPHGNTSVPKLAAIKGATMYVRDLGANESYWWQ